MAEKLTKRIIDSTIYKGDGDSKHIIWDSELTGLGLRVYPSGKKSFVLSYRQNGRKRLMVLGKYGVHTIDEARELAIDELAKIGSGNDPVEEKRRQAKAQTFAELCHAYIHTYAKVHKKSWGEDERRINNHLLPVWRHHLIKSLTRSDISSLHNKMGLEKPYEANRTLALLSKMFDLAIEWGFLDENHVNPATRIKKFKEEKRDRWVGQDEMPKLMEAIHNESNTYARYAILLYLLTGMRKNELLRIKWEDINWERSELRLGETKAGRVHYIPLSSTAKDILREIPKQTDNPYVLVGNKSGSHLINIHKPWVRIRKEASLEDVRLHDLRRTVGSWLAGSGHSLQLIGKVLNHSNQSTTAIYARLSENSVASAMEGHGEALRQIMNR